MHSLDNGTSIQKRGIVNMQQSILTISVLYSLKNNSLLPSVLLFLKALPSVLAL